MSIRPFRDIKRRKTKKIKVGKVEITTLKQNVKTMLEEPHTRIVEPLNLPNLPMEGEKIILILIW